MLLPLLNAPHAQPVPFGSAPKPAFSEFLNHWEAKLAHVGSTPPAAPEQACPAIGAADGAMQASVALLDGLPFEMASGKLADVPVNGSVPLHNEKLDQPAAENANKTSFIHTRGAARKRAREAVPDGVETLADGNSKSDTADRAAQFLSAPPLRVTIPELRNTAAPVPSQAASTLVDLGVTQTMNEAESTDPSPLPAIHAPAISLRGAHSMESGARCALDRPLPSQETGIEKASGVVASEFVSAQQRISNPPVPSDEVPSVLEKGFTLQTGDAAASLGHRGLAEPTSRDESVPIAPEAALGYPGDPSTDPTGTALGSDALGSTPLTFPQVLLRTEGSLIVPQTLSVGRAVATRTHQPASDHIRPRNSALDSDVVATENMDSPAGSEKVALGPLVDRPRAAILDRHRETHGGSFAAGVVPGNVRQSEEPKPQGERPGYSALPPLNGAKPTLGEERLEAAEVLQPALQSPQFQPLPSPSSQRETALSPISVRAHREPGNNSDSARASTWHPRTEAEDAGEAENSDPALLPAHDASRESGTASLSVNKSVPSVPPPHATPSTLASTSDSRFHDAPPASHPEDLSRPVANRPEIDSALPKTRAQEVPAQEVHLNLRSAELGRVEIRTILKDDHITAHVAVENSAAQKAIDSELSGLRGALAAADIKLDNFSVASTADSRSGGSQPGGGSPQEQGQTRHFPASTVHRVSEAESDESFDQCSINVVV